MGRKKRPHYRIVVADSASPRDGRFVETLGYYKPLAQPARLVLDMERVDHWIAEGASPSGTVKSLITKARKGGVHNHRQVVKFLGDREMASKLFDEIGPRYEDRQGGYLRIIKLDNRSGDNAPMARIEFV